MLAAVLLGGGPAALIGVLTISLGWLRPREDTHYLLNNLATYARFPLLGGLFFHATTRAAHAGRHALAYYLLVSPRSRSPWRAAATSCAGWPAPTG
jgi:hypothetical protein